MQRTDAIRMDLASAVVDPDSGWWTVEGTAALEGVLSYGNVSEYLPASTLEESASGLIGMPVVVTHPRDGKLLNASNTRDYQGGTVIDSRMDGDRLRVKLLLTDQDAIAAVQSGIDELSPGYDVRVDEKAGEFNGKRYDRIQTWRKYNHLALVPRARGGREARLDGMATVNIDGMEFEVDPKVKQYIDSLASRTTDAAPPPEAEPEMKQEVKMDAAEIVAAVTKNIVAELKAERVRTDAAARELGETIVACRPHLPASYRTDGKDRGQILADSILAIKPELAPIVKDKSGDVGFLQGMFGALTIGAPRTDASAETRTDAGEDADPVTAAYQRQVAGFRAIDGGKK